MNFLSDVITYIRRIIKSPSNASISDDLLIDYINRFWIMDVDARLQVFDLKTKYQFQTQPGVDQYNMPLYSPQTETGGNVISTIGMYPVYQGFLGPAYINGIPVRLETQKDIFFNNWINVVQSPLFVGVGDGGAGPYTFQIPISPQNSLPPSPLNPPIQALLRGHVDIRGIIATGVNVDPPLGSDLNRTITITGPFTIPSTSIIPAIYFTATASDGTNIIVQDSGQFLTDSSGQHANYGLLMAPGPAPFGYNALFNTLAEPNPYSINQNTINYLTGVAKNVTFPAPIPLGTNIYAQCFYFQTGLPRAILYYNNILTFRNPPDRQYMVELDAYLSPSSFMTTTEALPFAYMAEYIARGAARKILLDTGDVEQFQFYEPEFRSQELLVWKRSQRQWTATRTQTIYSQGQFNGTAGFNNFGNGVTL